MPDKQDSSSGRVIDNLLYCRKSDVPIRLDKSLRNLNRAQVELLLTNLPSKQQEQRDKEYIKSLDPSTYIDDDRLKMFNEIQKSAGPPIHVQDFFNQSKHNNGNNNKDDDEFEDEEDDEDDMPYDDIASFADTLTSFSYLVIDDDGSTNGDSDEIKSGEGRGGVSKNEISNDYQNQAVDEDFKLSERLKALNKIFEILANKSEIDHPLSEDAANQLIENYKLKFDQTQREKDSYLTFLKKLKDKDTSLVSFEENGTSNSGSEAASILSEEEVKDLDSKLKQSLQEYKQLSQEEQDNLNELKQLENQKVELETELSNLKQQLDDLYKHDLSEILVLRNKLKLDIDKQNNKLEQSKSAYKMHLNHLDKLRNMNIYTTLFNITFDDNDKYALINGFRLGYKIVWPEVNAALGQIVVLLIFLINRLKFNLIDYKLLPMGSHSQIIKFSSSHPQSDTHNQSESVESSATFNETTTTTVRPSSTTENPKTVLNLYSSDEFSLGKLFNYNDLDVSMIALLDIVSQVETKLMEIDHEIQLPYRISPHKDSIGGKSIRVTSKHEWTDSCKFLLTNLNWMLRYTSVRNEPTS
ncbi:autophagy protein Apg6-domain-containing protein [Scheffersomyces coipomensis]|uniref:autophagy protein Apg6-domain-containing protein n=1 Tax=Scheffersomyces coipomensis TaxID=1788519 RepID=UPI00315D4640